MGRRWLSSIAVALVLIGTVVSTHTAETNTPLTRAPDFILRECVLADSIHLADFSDHPVLLFFFDAGDAAMRPAYPYLNEWQRRYKNDGLKVIGIHCPQYEPLKKMENASTAIGRAGLKFPVGMDWDWKVFNSFHLEQLPTFVLLGPGLKPSYSVSRLRAYTEVEQAIQNLLKQLKPGIILPFLVKHIRPEDNPQLRLLETTPKIELGYTSGSIANCDSSDFGKFAVYTDPGDRKKGVVYLDGRWRVDEKGITCKLDSSYTRARLRVLYSGKAVWLLADFPPGKPPRIYVKQDRSYLPSELWGNDIRFDEMVHPFVLIRYAVPLHIVENKTHGAHQLELIIEDGAATFYYLFFESAVER